MNTAKACLRKGDKPICESLSGGSMLRNTLYKLQANRHLRWFQSPFGGSMLRNRWILWLVVGLLGVSIPFRGKYAAQLLNSMFVDNELKGFNPLSGEVCCATLDALVYHIITYDAIIS